MVDFLVESIQQAIFLRQPPPLDALKLWETGVGLSPDGFQRFPDGSSQATGQLTGAHLMLAVQPTNLRVDLHFQGLAEQPPPVIADVESVLARGIEIAQNLVGHLAVGRAATVLQGIFPTATGGEGVSKLQEVVSGFPAPAGTEEATYHVLVPRTSAITAGRRINQICRWLVVQYQYVQIGMGVQSHAARRGFGLQAIVDVFATDLAELNSEMAIGELKEVGEIARRIMKGGPSELSS